ncbi:MAG: hypothetical protein ACM3MI_08510 [Clostridiales bacterium]
MTYSGMQFIDLFIDALRVKKKSGEKVISDRNAEIVRLVYDFENNRMKFS